MTTAVRTEFRRRSVEVDAAVDRAFEVFVHMTAWWPREHRVVAADLHDVVIEPSVGGRCYQVDVDSGECDWGGASLGPAAPVADRVAPRPAVRVRSRPGPCE